MKERYFSLKSGSWSEDQGIILKVNENNELKDISTFLSVTTTQKESNPLEYEIVIDLNFLGTHGGSPKRKIGLRILDSRNLEIIYQQSEDPMFIEEISKKTAYKNLKIIEHYQLECLS